MFYHLLEFKTEDTIELVEEIEEFLETSLGQTLSAKGFTLCERSGDKPDLVIYLAYHADGLRKKTVNKYILANYRKTSDPDDPFKQPGPNIEYIPILTLCLEKSQIESRAFGIQYLDSSIWQRWIVAEDPKFEEDFPLLLDELRRYHDGKLYKSPVTQEYCEFTTRIYKNSYLHENGMAGHTNDVVPFPFFQEGKFRQRFNKKRKVYEANLKQLRWRILLVDDKAMEKSDGKSDPVNQKLDLIKGVLSELFTVETGDPTPQVGNHATAGLPIQEKPYLQIQYAPDVDTALNMLKNVHFDIILLDYLLGLESEKSEVRQLGIALLSEMFEQKNKIKLGPDNRLWIFSVTSFSWAFIDHIREEGLSQHHTMWTFTRGADPVNTPNAFLFYFTEFLNSQYEEFKGEDSLVSIWENALKQFKKSGSGESKDTHQFTRNWANKTLNHVLNYWSKGDSLNSLISKAKSDSEIKEKKEKSSPGKWGFLTPKGMMDFFKKNQSNEIVKTPDDARTGDPGDSYFAKSFIASDAYKVIRKDYNSGLYGYLTHFLFMLSFSDGYEWEEMKTNLDIITAKIKESDDTKDGYQILRKRIESLQELYVK